MNFSLRSFSLIAVILAARAAGATFNCSMNVNVNSRVCAGTKCAIAGSYLAGQIVAFDCVNVADTVAGSPWWARDPLKHFVPVGDMLGVDKEPCDTHLGLCASLPSL
ncbi:hypothetical protein C8R46DRAFT_1038722 [Mycena filopes]|nr:hypothetical protein C8R46DRAFT_1038722 [Mycena filopes]